MSGDEVKIRSSTLAVLGVTLVGSVTNCERLNAEHRFKNSVHSDEGGFE